MILKKFYRFLSKHTLGIIRILYLALVVAVILKGINSYISEYIIAVCVVISVTVQVGILGKWDREDEYKDDRITGR